MKSSKKKKYWYKIKNFNPKQIVNQTSNIISTNKSKKQFGKIKKQNQTNTVSSVSMQ